MDMEAVYCEKKGSADGLADLSDTPPFLVDSYVNAYLGSKFFCSQLEHYKDAVKHLGVGIFKGSRFSVSVSERKQSDVVDTDWKRICEVYCENVGISFNPSDELVAIHTKRIIRPNVLAVLPPVPLCTPVMLATDL